MYSLKIIASCTQRKAVTAPAEAQARNLPDAPIDERIKLWTKRLSAHQGPALPAEELYIGDLWQVTKSLRAMAHDQGYAPVLHICSAGYGLVSATARLRGYESTFAPGQPDSVCANQADTPSWWTGLTRWVGPEPTSPRSLEQLAYAEPKAVFLVLLSPVYLEAVKSDLIKARKALVSPTQMVVVSSAAPGDLKTALVRSDARMTHELGGTLISLNARLSRHLIDVIPPSDFGITSATTVTRALLERQPPLRQFKRRPIDEDDLEAYIIEAISGVAKPYKTPLLRALRNAGVACEQKRFGLAFDRVMEATRG